MSESTALIAPATAARKTPEEPLFEPVRLGRYDLPHRMVMAPLTRSRARHPGNVPSALNACYYAQRASAALIVGEASQVSQQGQGYAAPLDRKVFGFELAEEILLPINQLLAFG